MMVDLLLFFFLGSICFFFILFHCVRQTSSDFGRVCDVMEEEDETKKKKNKNHCKGLLRCLSDAHNLTEKCKSRLGTKGEVQSGVKRSHRLFPFLF